MFQSIDLQLKLEALETASGGSIWGNIWLETGDYAFPSQQWNDCAEGILEMWLVALTDIYTSKNKWYEKDFVFMDGPYEATLRNGSPVTIRFKQAGETVNIFPVSLTRFARQVVAQKRLLLAHRQKDLLLAKYSSQTTQCDWLEILIDQSEEQQKRPV
ncbi:hypothetical protein E5K00_05170 [Hymenobacter aquaticus]|uniref:Uncharacterized protein n=1 Tax=Hymenobacter aquaticus TaxID=1867101 RepID=A0A4Z0Q554_9BACT|nr:hypothetical protein [Hymenobacter aquaticus]TGE24606.1 hypothetical protein E5K00_05170 [Hymenobacter aquaticus]